LQRNQGTGKEMNYMLHKISIFPALSQIFALRRGRSTVHINKTSHC